MYLRLFKLNGGNRRSAAQPKTICSEVPLTNAALKWYYIHAVMNGKSSENMNLQRAGAAGCKPGQGSAVKVRPGAGISNER